METMMQGCHQVHDPLLAPVLPPLQGQAGRMVCLLDTNNRLSPWLGGGAGKTKSAELDLSLRPVQQLAASPADRASLTQFKSAYETSGCLSLWLLRKRPEEHFEQARRLAFWELGAAVMGLEKSLVLPAPWQFALWVPADSRVEGLWLLDMDLREIS